MAKKRPKKAGRKPPPKCKAILLCDSVIVDAMTGKNSIIGIFGVFNVPTFPGHTSPFHAYLQLTDGIGDYQVTVEVHDLREDKVLARAEIAKMNFADRSAKQHLVIPVPPLPLEHEGVYDFVVLADGQEIDRQQFQAHARGTGNAANQPDQPEEPG